jgi:hypothetical protein
MPLTHFVDQVQPASTYIDSGIVVN